MGTFDPFLQRPGFRGCALAIREARAIVLDPDVQPVVLNREVHIDTVGVAVPDCIGDRFPKHLLQIELKADWYRPLIAVSGNMTVYRPLLAQAFGERAQFGDGVGKPKFAFAAQRKKEASNFGLLFHEQPL